MLLDTGVVSLSMPRRGRDCRNDEECGINTYLFRGKDLGTADKVVYDAKVEEHRQKECSAAEGAWKDDGKPGKFSKDGCTAKWKCDDGDNGAWPNFQLYFSSSIPFKEAAGFLTLTSKVGYFVQYLFLSKI